MSAVADLAACTCSHCSSPVLQQDNTASGMYVQPIVVSAVKPALNHDDTRFQNRSQTRGVEIFQDLTQEYQ